jgi:hypothetical protein
VVWACTPKPQNFALDPPVATPGEQPAKVTATGQSVADSEVTLHWNGVDGPVLAETSPDMDGHFTATFEVPEQAEPGVAYVVASTGEDSTQGVARAALEITGSGEPGETAATSAWQAGQQPTTADTPAGPAGMSTPTLAGLGMLTLGSVALFASFSTVAVQRRRTPVRG